MLSSAMPYIVAPFLIVAAAAAAVAPMGRAQLLQAAAPAPAPAAVPTYSPLGTYGMAPCKRCGGGLHSRDDLLDMQDGTLNKMKGALEDEIEELEGEVKALKQKNGAELGKLKKRLSDMTDAYKKFDKDSIARTAAFAGQKANTSKVLDGLLDGTAKANAEITELRETMIKLRNHLNPYVDNFISGKGWPKDCKCAKAKALLQRLQVTLHLAGVDLSTAVFDDEVPKIVPRQSLLRKSIKASKPADLEKYKLVRSVQQLEEKRAKLMQDKSTEISSYGQVQRVTLDRIDAAKIKAKLKVTTESKYKTLDADLEKHLKSQIESAESYKKASTAQVARLKENEKKALKLFGQFQAALKKCKCLTYGELTLKPTS